MTAYQTKSQCLAIKEETTEGTIQAIAANTDYIPLREGFQITNESEVIDTDEMNGDIGMSEAIRVGENPSSSWAGYLKGSGTQGTSPEYITILESCLGAKTEASTEYDTIAGSTVSKVVVDSGEGSNFEAGMAVRVQDNATGRNHSIRNITSVSTDDLNLNFDLDNAPASGVNLGKAVLVKPANSGHPTFTMHHFQSSSSSAYKQIMAGCRTVNLAFEFPTRDLASLTADIEALKYYYNPITISSTNKYIDITDDLGTYAVTLTEKTYKTPLDLAREIADKATIASAASGADTISCSYSNTAGTFTISSDGTVLSLLWSSGANAANSVGETIGFTVSSDDTGALTYTSDNAITFNDASYSSPSYDSPDPIVCRNGEFFIGASTSITCKKIVTASITVATPKTNVLSVCAENGHSESLILSREVTASFTMVLSEYDADLFDRNINNTNTQWMFNVGEKDNEDNWTAGKCANFWGRNSKINTISVQDNEGYQVLQIECKCYVDGTNKDFYINFL